MIKRLIEAGERAIGADGGGRDEAERGAIRGDDVIAVASRVQLPAEL